MRVLVLPFLPNIDLMELQNIINKNTIKINVQDGKKESATTSYSIQNKKFILSDQCGITQKDVSKIKEEHLGNGITRTTINKKPCMWIVLKGGSDVSQKNIDKILEIARQEDLKQSNA